MATPRFRPLRTAAVALLAAGALLTATVDSAFAAAPSAPTVTTGHVVSVTPASAVVTGTVDPNGSPTTWYFEYGLSTPGTFTSSTPVTDAGTGTAVVPVTVTLHNLASATSYNYRIVGVNKLGTIDGASGLLNTSAAPVVLTGAASDLTASSATLNGEVNPEGLATHWYFQYGLNTDYGTSTPVSSLDAGPNNANVSATISGLAPESTYHFRVVAQSTTGTSYGADLTLVTGLSVTLNAATSTTVYGSSVMLSGAVASGLAGQSVTIESEQYNQSVFSGIASVQTGTNGSFSYDAQPTTRTSFEAVANGGASSPIVLSVRPEVLFSINAHGVLTTRVIGAVTFASHVLQLQRLTGGLWVTWKHVRLNDVAVASFATSLPVGRTMVRMAIGPFVLGIDQAAPGYLAGYSRALSYLHR